MTGSLQSSWYQKMGQTDQSVFRNKMVEDLSLPQMYIRNGTNLQTEELVKITFSNNTNLLDILEIMNSLYELCHGKTRFLQ